MPVTATLTVDLSAIGANYRLLKARHAQHRSAAVVKADAYGLGMAEVAEALYQGEGCKTFFVATLEEAIVLRQTLANSAIYVFQGILKGEAAEFRQFGLRPVLNSLAQIEAWQRARAPDARAALHIDTGMCRLGLSGEELPGLDPAALAASCGLDLLMSHLACASEPEHPLNAEQLRRFGEARKMFPMLPASLANSSGHFLSPEFHFDLGRPGCGLYGISPSDAIPNPMRNVAVWRAPILQIRALEREQTIGYGATMTLPPGTRVATLAVGYADGLHRIASPTPEWAGIAAYLGEYACPMLGRISMDTTCYDVTAVPESLLESAYQMTLMDHRQPVDVLAKHCGTIGYEVLTSIGSRVRRTYAQSPSS